MSKTSYAGIDYSYSTGLANKDDDNVRYGVIAANHVGQYWFDEAESVYPCEDCDGWDSENECCSEECPCCEPSEWKVENDDLVATQCEDGDIFVLKSKFYTFAQFCSPCAPGACYLENWLDEPVENNKCYCLGPDWFEGECPYPVWSFKTGEKIYTPEK